MIERYTFIFMIKEFLDFRVVSLYTIAETFEVRAMARRNDMPLLNDNVGIISCVPYQEYLASGFDNT